MIYLMIFVDPPSGNPVIGYINPFPVFYKGDNIEMTCCIPGGLPPTNLSWDCDGLTSSSQRVNSSHSWLTASGTATKWLNGKTCTCTAQHYAWIPLGSNLRTVQTPNITVYCEYWCTFLSRYLSNFMIKINCSGTATKSLNGKTCTCTAQHYAWIPLGSNLRTVQTPNITGYCEHWCTFLSRYLSNFMIKINCE